METGQWWAPHLGHHLGNPSHLDVDHHVPLRNAHVLRRMGLDTSGERGVRQLPRSLAGKALAGFCATQSRRIQDLYGMVVHVIRYNTHYVIDNRR